MDISMIIMTTVILSGVALVLGLFLGVSNKKFAVEVDPREEAIINVLPGNNCGGCGFAGCSGLAAAIVAGKAEVNGCPVGGAPVGKKVAELMGVDSANMVHKVAYVKCAGDCEAASTAYDYSGAESCKMVSLMQNQGPKACVYGCTGFGDCVKACPFDSIHILNGIAVVDRETCKACGKCVKACPKNLIELIPYDNKYHVRCASKDKGKDVMKYCKAGCIACKICEKACKSDAVKVEDNIACIDYDKCVNCGACAEKCPKKVIQ